MNAKELAKLFISRIENWKLEWEVLWMTFQSLIDKGVSSDTIEEALREGLSEWDL